MEVTAIQLTSGYNYFVLISNDKCFSHSVDIASLLNLNVHVYNKLLIEKVIKHDNYHLRYDSGIFFKLNNIPKETYIERFKDTFNKELTLLALGGA